MPIMTHTMNRLTPELNAHGSSMTNIIQRNCRVQLEQRGLITILSTASKNFQPTMSDYQGMDKKKWQDKYKSMLCFMVIIQVFICRYYYIHQFIAYIFN